MVSRGSGRPRSTQKDWVGVDEAGRGDEGLARGPLRSVRPGEVLLWDWGSSSCARDPVGGDCREGSGVASRGSCPGPGNYLYGIFGYPGPHLVDKPVRQRHGADCSKGYNKRTPSLVQCGESRGGGGVFPTLA